MADIKIVVDSSDVSTATNRVDQLGTSGTVAQKGIDKAARGMNQFGVVAKNGGKKMNTFNMQMQQGGYQLQDFVVQLQSGTSFFTAFGQQGSQFAGVFGPKGAVIGAIIAIGSAVGGMGYKMIAGASAGRTLEDALKDLDDVMNELDASSKLVNASFKELDERFGSAGGKVKELASVMQQLTMREAVDGANALKDELLEMYNGNAWANVSRAEDMYNALRIGGKSANEFMAALNKLKGAGDLKSQAEAATAMREQFEALVGSADQMTTAQLEYFTSLVDTEVALLEVQAKLNKAVKGQSVVYKDLLGSAWGLAEAEAVRQELLGNGYAKQAVAEAKLASENKRYETAQDKILERQNAQRKKANAAAKLELKTLADRNLLLLIEKKDGKDSVLYRRTALKVEKEALKARLEAKSVSGEIIAQLVAQLDAQDKYLHNVDETAKTYVDILGSSEGLKSSTEAINDVYQTGLDRLKAQKEQMFKMRALAETYGTGVGGEFGGVPTGLDPFGGKGDYRYDESSTFKPPKDKKKKEERDPVAEFQKQLDLEDALFGKTEARQQVLKALGEDLVAKNPIIVADMEAQIEANQKLIDLEKQRQALSDHITSSMEDGFMAMVDGTMSVKDAFKSMAYEIIKELYRVLVVQQMVNAAKMAFGFADGGVINGGSEVKAYANGGVVGGPTTFPMAGGKTGLMGEAGPEAIMPLKRGANGKLGVQAEGGSGDIYVTNNYSISANTSEDTKRLVTQTIQQAQPALTQAAKASIMNDRRRGGQMKSVFG